MTARAGRATADRLHDILTAVDRVMRAERQLSAADQAGDESAMEVAYDAVLYNLVVIGEAVNALPDDVTSQESGVPWRDIVDMRNFLSHEYFRVLAEVVHRTIDEPLEQLRVACHRLIESAE
ncbi:MAG: HepT-like ribonuclease domain-containing protein [Natronosporangium sp.]